MKITDTEFPDVKIIENYDAYDVRGFFIKIFNEAEFQSMGLETDFKETYYSKSKKDTIRGMHFQTPPFDHAKLIHVIHGEVVDVILDLRKDSPNYKKYITLHLTGNKPKSIYIPRGFAHGFKCLENDTLMLYNTTSGYSKEHDMGVRWDSIGYDWNVSEPIISERDKGFVELSEYDSPF